MSRCATPNEGVSVAGVCGSYIFMSILDDYIRSRTDISGLCDRIKPIRQPEVIYDFIVIGGGSGGATVAGRLAQQKKWSVLLVEAGPDEPPGTQVPSMFSVFVGSPQIDWNYTTEPQKHACLGNPGQRCPMVRAKVLGGCSVLNGMMYIRGLPADYHHWMKAGNFKWSSKHTLQGFKSFENNLEIGTLADEDYHSTGGPVTVSRFPHHPKFSDDLLAAARECGYPVSNDLNGKQKTGFSIAQVTHSNGTRLSASKAFLWPERNNRHLHVMLNTTAESIQIWSSRRGLHRATSVRLVYKGRSYQVKVRYEIIVAGGAINSPQLLMLSGVGPRKHLKSVGIRPVINLPGVGENYQNHVSFTLKYALKKLNNSNDLDCSAINEYFDSRGGPMSSTGLSQITARLNSPFADSNGQWPDLQFFFNGFSASCGTTGNASDPADDSPYKTIQIIPAVLHPKSRGQIQLRSDNIADKPLLKVQDLQHPDDVKTLVAGIRIAQRIASTKILRDKYGIELVKDDFGYCSDKYAFDSDEFWSCAVQYATTPENHQVGTCKMGPENDIMAVVNQELIVHKTCNIRIIDASVIPFVVSGNTAATVMMVAERGARFLINAYT